MEDGVCVQVHTVHVRRRVIKVKVARIHSNNKWTRGAQHVSQRQGAQRDVRTRPVEGKDHLRLRTQTETPGMLLLDYFVLTTK